MIDVGTGLAVFVEGADFALLYDAGSQDDLAQREGNRVVAYLRAVRPDLRRLDHVILSHPHKDHLELMPDVFDAFEVANVWESGRVNRTAGYCKFLTKVVAEGAVYHDAIASNGSRTVTFSGSTCKGSVVLTQGPMMTAAPVSLNDGAGQHGVHRRPSPGADASFRSSRYPSCPTSAGFRGGVAIAQFIGSDEGHALFVHDPGTKESGVGRIDVLVD